MASPPVRIIYENDCIGQILTFLKADFVISPIDRIRLVRTYGYGNIRCMKKTLHIDNVTLRDAKKACGAATDTETVRLGLEVLIRQAAYQRLRKLKGSDVDAKDVPRRRPAARKRRTAA